MGLRLCLRSTSAAPFAASPADRHHRGRERQRGKAGQHSNDTGSRRRNAFAGEMGIRPAPG